MKYFFDSYGFTSSGAIAALVQGLLAKELWKRGAPKQLAGARCTALACIKVVVEVIRMWASRVTHLH